MERERKGGELGEREKKEGRGEEKGREGPDCFERN